MSFRRRIGLFMQGRGPLRLAWVCLPMFVTGYQITAKTIADGTRIQGAGAELTSIVSNPVLLLLVGCEIGSFIVWMYVLARMQLSEAFPLSAISYVFVLLSSWAIFHETSSVGQLIGSAAIVIGVWLIGRRPEHEL